MHPDPDERELLWLAALGLALVPGGVARWRARHRPSPIGTCAGCARPWPCRFASIADLAHGFLVAAVQQTSPTARPPWDDTVPPVIGPGDLL